MILIIGRNSDFTFTFAPGTNQTDIYGLPHRKRHHGRGTVAHVARL